MKKSFCIVLAVIMFCVMTDFSPLLAASTNSDEVIEFTAAQILREHQAGKESRIAFVNRIFKDSLKQ